MNLINKLPLMAFVLGLGLMATVITMSSFKGERLDTPFSRDPISGVWSPLVATEGPGLHQYQCSNPDITYCTGYFDISNPAPNAIPTSNGRFGDFEINE